MALASDTYITLSDKSEKLIQHVRMNDLLLTAEKPNMSPWVEKPLLFIKESSGVNHLVQIEFQNGARQGLLVVSPDQSFLTPAKTLKQAEYLIAGRDLLVMENGNTCPIISFNSFYSDLRTFDIATTSRPGENNRRLLIANGIVLGDYMTRWLK